MPDKTWVEEMTAEWQAIPESELIEPSEEMKDGDNEVGVLSFRLRQMSTLLCRKSEALEKMKEEERGNGKPEWSDECYLLIRDANAIRNVFFRELEQEFPALARHGVQQAVRKGWKAVWRPLGEEPELSYQIAYLAVPDELKAAVRAISSVSETLQWMMITLMIIAAAAAGIVAYLAFR